MTPVDPGPDVDQRHDAEHDAEFAQSFTFSHATRQVIFGAGSRSALLDLAAGAARSVLICDPFFATAPHGEEIFAALPDPGLHVIPGGEPTGASVSAAAETLVKRKPDLVVALGGGSAIDTAKAALALAANPGDLAPLFFPSKGLRSPYPGRFIAIATTAGSGSEVSETAVVDLPGTVYKAHMRAPFLAPEVAILDPELTLSTPPEVTAVAGFDALTHAIEAYTSRAATPMTDPLALSAITLLARHLRRATEVPADLAARSGCLLASAQAGIAFNSAHLGLAHAIAGALGALHHVTHGMANALALPWTTAFNAAANGDKERIIAELFQAESAAAGVSRLRAELGLDRSLDAFLAGPVDDDAIARAALTSGQIRMNPRLADEADIKAILQAMRRPTHGGAPALAL